MRNEEEIYGLFMDIAKADLGGVYERFADESECSQRYFPRL